MTTQDSQNIQAPLSPEVAVALCGEAIHIMATGAPADFWRLIHPLAVNREAKDEPPACREPGPGGFYATALWLREAFSELAFDIHESVAAGDLVAVHCTMRGRHTGPMVGYDNGGEISTVFPPTGRTFAVTHTHWMRHADGQVIEHWANRDDIGAAQQLGWVPPTPMFMVRMALAKRKARRALKRSP